MLLGGLLLNTMIVLFISILIISCLLFRLILFFIKSKPERAIGVEISGYILLLISLLWGFVVIETENVSNGQSDIILNEKLNMLWEFEREKTRNSDTENIYALYEEHSLIDERWLSFNESNKLIGEQEELANKLQYFIVGLSTILIASGRIGEIIISSKSKKTNEEIM